MRRSYGHLLKIICLSLFIGLFLVAGVSSSNQADEIEDLKRGVARIGQLSFKADVPVKYFSREDLTEYINRLFEEEYPVELSSREQAFLFWMGYLNEGVDLRDLRRKIIIENVGGLYNESTKELYALEEYRNVDLMNSLILVHEFRHALQDQYYYLAKMPHIGTSDFDDRKLALLTAIEGDATFLMVKYMNISPELLTASFDSESLLSLSSMTGTATLSQAPEILKYQLIMPYMQGLSFVYHIFKKKDWKGVNRILSAPPVSSEQLLHPEKYLKGEKPLPVNISFEPDGYETYHTGVLGEYYINILLKPDDRYIELAGGWGGDRFKLFRRGDSYLLFWKSLWDKKSDGNRFFTIFREFLKSRFHLDFKRGVNKGQVFFAGKSDRESSENDHYFFISNKKNQVVYLRSNDRDTINSFIDGGRYD